MCKVLTKVVLQKRKILSKNNDVSCVPCGSDREDVDHFFGFCSLLWLWCQFLDQMGCQWVVGKSTNELNLMVVNGCLASR